MLVRICLSGFFLLSREVGKTCVITENVKRTTIESFLIRYILKPGTVLFPSSAYASLGHWGPARCIY